MWVQVEIRLRWGRLSSHKCLDVGVPEIAVDLSGPASYAGEGSLAFAECEWLQERKKSLAEGRCPMAKPQLTTLVQVRVLE